MTKKHFKLLAHYISSIISYDCRLNAAVAVASACKEANPRFDCDQFFAACNLGALKLTDHGIEYR